MANCTLNICDQTENRQKIVNFPNSDVFLYFQSLFKTIDTNQDGYISVGELKNFLDNNEHENFPENIVKSVYKKFDKNKDEKLEFEEFLEMVTDPDFKSSFEKVTERVLKYVSRSQRCHERLRLKRTVTATGAYEKENKFRKSLLVMVIITVLQIIAFYCNEAYLTETEEEGPLRRLLKFNPCRKIEIYRYVSHIFIHSDRWHLYGNIVEQVLLGIPLEMVHGWRVMLIYFSGAVGGCVTHSVFGRIAESTGLVGASGAVFSFYTAHIAAVILNWREMSHPAVHLILFGVVVSIDVVYKAVMVKDPSDTISYYAHGGGALTGLLIGVLILRNLNETKRENTFWHVCFMTLLLLTLIFVELDICLPLKNNDCPNVQTQHSSLCNDTTMGNLSY